MKEAELAAAVDANYWQGFALLAVACGGKLLERDGVLAISTGLPVAMLNIGFVKQPLADPEASMREVASFYDEEGMPFVLRVREGVDRAAEETMTAMGMPYSDMVPGMAMFPIGGAPPLPPDLTVEPVRDELALAAYQQVLAEGFGMPLDLAKRLIAPAFLDSPGFESYLGIAGGEPVATSTLYAGEGTAGVYNVATLAAQRGRGIGAAMTWHAIARGREQGCAVAILQASAMGKPVYERMGFRTVAPYRTFHRLEKEAQ